MPNVESEEPFLKVNQNEAAIRLWINAFFYRVAPMGPSSSKFILRVEQNVQPVGPDSVNFTSSLSGFVDFTLISTDVDTRP